jgi:hypothetical protein
MSSFYSDASLVMIPSGYKNQKVYSAVPTDGTGDLTFTRASDATRVASNGLIEKVRTNLCLQSNTFNTTWATTSASVTSGQAGYDGTNNAWLLTKSGASGRINQSFSLGAQNTFSVYAKANASSYIAIEFSTSFIYVNLTNGAQGSIGTGSYKIQSIGSGWYRIIMTSTVTSSVFRIYPAENNALAATTGSIFIQNAQVETGDIATDPIITTTAAVSVGPVSGLPRLDYLNSTCPKLLLEPQRTNLLTFSEQFDNAAWTKQTGITITANTTETLDPSGYYGAEKVVSTSGSTGFFQSGLSLTSDITRTIYLKGAVGGETLKLKDPSGFGGNTSVTLTTSWVRYEHKTTNTGDTYQGLFVDDISNGATIYAWGCQLEASSSYATSYIPTLGASVTRVVDACYKTGITSLIGQTEGVAFIDFVWNGLTGVGSFPRIIELATDSSNLIQLYSVSGTTSWGWEIVNGGVVQFSGSSTMALGRNKIAIGYKLNDMVIYKNGTLVASDATCTVPATSSLGVTGVFNGGAGAQLAASVNQTLLFKTRLTNSQLQELTTL